MYQILEKRDLSSAIYAMKIEAPLVAKNAKPGQFIILRVNEEGERVVFTISDYNAEEGWVDIIVQRVGFTTELLGHKQAGDSIVDFAGPLGKPSKLDGLKRVLCVGGGVGIAPLYPQIKYLKAQGTKVDVIIGARSKDILILENEVSQYADNLYIATDDGTAGRKGLVTDIMRELFEKGEAYDEVIVAGPMIMMKFCSMLTKEFNIKTTASMNPVMVDGTGMCGCCRVTVAGKTRYACVEGPDFDAHEIDFDEAMRRLSMYKKEEEQAKHECKIGRGK